MKDSGRSASRIRVTTLFRMITGEDDPDECQLVVAC
jgi:hypothetical protein